MMDKELKQKWVAALRSGEYKQTVGVLKNHENCYCALGVLHDIKDPNGWFEGFKGYGHTTGTGEIMTGEPLWVNILEMNDKEEKSFPEIAEYIENEDRI
jgi:hypothetical protein